MSRTIAELFDIPSHEGAYLGYEVELEGVHLDVPHSDVYTDLVQCIHDGSLRNGGAEFIFKQPLLWNSSTFLQALSDIGAFGEEYDACTSHRTSTHVHLNVSDLDPEQLKRVLYLSLCLEPVLMKYCSVHRQHNRFCLPSYKSSNFLGNVRAGLGYLLHDTDAAIDNLEQYTKYAAISLHRLPSLGTVEYRMFDGTYDKDKLKSIGKIVSTIRRIALNRTIKDIQTAKVQGTLYDILGAEISDTFGYVSSEEFSTLFEKGSTQANDLLMDFTSIHIEVLNRKRNHERVRTKLEQREDSESNQREDQPTQGETTQQDRPFSFEAVEPELPRSEYWVSVSSSLLELRQRPHLEPTRRGVPRGEQVNIVASGRTGRVELPRSPVDSRPDPSATVDSGEPVEGGDEIYTLGA